MKGLVFDTENRIQLKDFGEPLLDNLQKEVGGYIEVVHPKYLPEGLCICFSTMMLRRAMLVLSFRRLRNGVRERLSDLYQINISFNFDLTPYIEGE